LAGYNPKEEARTPRRNRKDTRALEETLGKGEGSRTRDNTTQGAHGGWKRLRQLQEDVDTWAPLPLAETYCNQTKGLKPHTPLGTTWRTKKKLTTKPPSTEDTAGDDLANHEEIHLESSLSKEENPGQLDDLVAATLTSASGCTRVLGTIMMICSLAHASRKGFLARFFALCFL